MQDQRTNDAPSPLSGAALAWAGILLCAVVAHLPALRGYFMQDDWPHLARAMGQLSTPETWARPVSRLVGFRLGFRLFGFEAAAWHASALIAWGIGCWLIYRLGRRFGLRELGAGAAALLAAGSPALILPVFWASASAEIFAVVFGLAAIEFWLNGRAGFGMLALLCALLSFFTKESMLALPLLLALHAWALGPSARRGRTEAALTGLAMGVGVVLAAALVWRGMAPQGPYDAYALGGPLLQLMNLGALGVWLISPWSFAPLATPGLPWLGLLVWAAWGAYGVLRARRGDRRVFWWWAWGVLVLAPVLPLQRHLQPYYLLAALPPLAWTLGSLLERLWPVAASQAVQTRNLLVVIGIMSAVVGFGASSSQLGARDARGSLTHPMAKRSAIAFETHRLVRSLPLERGRTLAVLAATYTEWPTELPVDLAQRLNSQVHVAIAGELGLRAMAPSGVITRWDSHLDGLRNDDLVLFDDGSARLRYWGRASNARFYSALIAVAARQYQRAMHDLWVIGGGGVETEFLYDEGLLPIPPEHLDDSGPEFVRYILRNEEDEALARRLVLLFQQMYEAVRQRPLDWASSD